MAKKLKSKKNSLEWFEIKHFLLSFERPFVILMSYLISMLLAFPQFADLIAYFGGVAVVLERLWALFKFYVKEYK
jgi:hypothetical protein